jgi:hypothetical protein
VLRAAADPTTLAGNPVLGPSLVADLIATIGPVLAGAPAVAVFFIALVRST